MRMFQFRQGTKKDPRIGIGSVPSRAALKAVHCAAPLRWEFWKAMPSKSDKPIRRWKRISYYLLVSQDIGEATNRLSRGGSVETV